MRDTSRTGDADTNNSRLLNTLDTTYEALWHIFPQEPPQNVADAHGQRMASGLIPESRTVTTRFFVDTDENSVTVTDNVGGMTPDTIHEVVTTIGETSDGKKDGNSGGSFGLGLWMMAAQTDTDNGGLYIESRHESGDDAVATVLFPTGEHYVADDGTPYADPDTVRAETGVTVDRDTPAEWDHGGTLFVAEQVNPGIIKELGDWPTVQERLQYKFPTLTGPENVRLTYTIDGTEHEYDAPRMDEIKGDVVEHHTDLEISKRDVPDDATIDELVFFNSENGTPWDGIPLLKTQPHTNRPYLVVDDYKPEDASLINNSGGFISAYARVDTACDVHNLEDGAHEGVQFNLSNHTNIADKATGIHREIIKNEIQKYSPPEHEFSEVANEAASELRRVMADVADGDLSLFGLDAPDATLTITPADADGLTVDVKVAVDPDAALPRTEYDVEVEGTNQSTDAVTETETVTVEAAPGEAPVTTVTLPDNGDGAYFVTGTLREKGVPDEIDTSGNLVGVGREIQPSASGGGGGGGSTTEATGIEEGGRTGLNDDTLRIVATSLHKDEQDSFFLIRPAADDHYVDTDEGFVLHIDLLKKEWIDKTVKRESKRESEQKSLVARRAAENLVGHLMCVNGNGRNSPVFQRLQSRTSEIADRLEI